VTTDELGFAVVGLGTISGLHMDAIERAKGARLAVVCDVNEDRARAVAAERGCAHATSHRHLLERDDVQVVDITTWSGLHAAIGIECARAGRHVLVTKPIDVRLEVIDELIATCDTMGVRVAAIHQSRSFDAYRRVKEAIDLGRIGRPLMGNAYCKWFRSQEYYDSARWRGTFELDGGGCLMNQGIHYIDALLWFMGDVETVAAHIGTLSRDIEVEDCATATLRFRSGALGSIQGATCIHAGTPARVEVHGEHGNLAVEGDEIALWQIEGEETFRQRIEDLAGADDPASGFAHALDAHVEQIGDLVAAIHEGREPTLSGREARRAVELILAVYRSSRTGEVVRLPLTGNSDPRAL
jgi:UDP-N-acetyl-2-amino-2-deoxyglucuronate dehydrogenase